jgi:hypothetical protein
METNVLNLLLLWLYFEHAKLALSHQYFLGKLTINDKYRESSYRQISNDDENSHLRRFFAHLLWWWKKRNWGMKGKTKKNWKNCQIKISSTWIFHFNGFKFHSSNVCMNTIMYVFIILSCNVKCGKI